MLRIGTFTILDDAISGDTPWILQLRSVTVKRAPFNGKICAVSSLPASLKVLSRVGQFGTRSSVSSRVTSTDVRPGSGYQHGNLVTAIMLKAQHPMLLRRYVLQHFKDSNAAF